MLIVGSRALQFYAQERGVPFRSPGDTDVICTQAEMVKYAKDFNVPLKYVSEGHYLIQTAPGRHTEFEVAESESTGHYYLSQT